MYVVSVSATTQNERYGDSELKLKHVVTLKTGENYIGIKDFINNNILKPISKDEFVDDYEKLNVFLKKQRQKLNKIYKYVKI